MQKNETFQKYKKWSTGPIQHSSSQFESIVRIRSCDREQPSHDGPDRMEQKEGVAEVRGDLGHCREGTTIRRRDEGVEVWKYCLFIKDTLRF